MTQLRGMSEEKSKQFWLLRRYLRQRHIDPALNFRVLRYVEYAVGQQSDLVPEGRVWILKYLSSQLRNELTFAVSFSCLNGHPLFDRTTQVSPDVMIRLSSTALSQHSLAVGDVLFYAGGESNHMYMLVTGDAQYIKAVDAALEDEFMTVSGGQWTCEVALWVADWVNVGTCYAVNVCTIVHIDKVQFADTVRKDPPAWEVISGYARNYLDWLNRKTRGELSDFVEHHEMLEVAEELLYKTFGRGRSMKSMKRGTIAPGALKNLRKTIVSTSKSRKTRVGTSKSRQTMKSSGKVIPFSNIGG